MAVRSDWKPNYGFESKTCVLAFVSQVFCRLTYAYFRDTRKHRKRTQCFISSACYQDTRGKGKRVVQLPWLPKRCQVTGLWWWLEMRRRGHSCWWECCAAPENQVDWQTVAFPRWLKQVEIIQWRWWGLGVIQLYIISIKPNDQFGLTFDSFKQRTLTFRNPNSRLTFRRARVKHLPRKFDIDASCAQGLFFSL